MKDIDTKKSHKGLLFLSLAALGVVYGDIGTSPLYAINEIFFGHGDLEINISNVIGAISLVVWALTLVVAFKYVVYVLRADKDGEGGVFALYSLLSKITSGRYIKFVAPLLVFAAGLLFGDGMITPAISVVSAVEGLKVVTNQLEPFVVPISILIIGGLFVIQRYGTAKVGSLFGPIITVWFITIGLLGLSHVVTNLEILKAFNPLYAVNFLVHEPFHRVLLILGSVMLVITGGEAMYADLGHFGKVPIRLSWFSIVYPALLLNYLGQGAFLISGAEVVQENIFYSMAPAWGVLPLVILATFATIIASQALISGAFSLAAQGIILNFFPLLKIKHTHQEHEGQIYIPFINWFLMVGCIIVVLIFRTSTRMAAAYGLAVSGVMFMTSVAMIAVARYYWKWSKLKSYLIFIPFAILDFTFLTSNSLKFLEGGFIPVLIGLGLLIVMMTWQWGRRQIDQEIERYSNMTVADLIKLKKKSSHFLPRSIVILSPTKVKDTADKVPALKQIFLDRYGVLPKHLIFLTVRIHRHPFVTHEDRHSIVKFYDDPEKGSVIGVTINFGFMENPDVEKALLSIVHHSELNIEHEPKKWLVHVIRERFFPSKTLHGFRRFKYLLFRTLLRNSTRADKFFNLGQHVRLTMEVIPIKIQ